MSRFIGAMLSVFLCILAAAATPAWAFWVTDGTALCTANGTQGDPTIASDGSGGAIVTWVDYRIGNSDIYAQRVNASGAVQWTADGVALCTSTGNQYMPKIVSDGSGGAIVTWYDYRSGNYDIYAQRVNASGAVQWTANGVALCTVTGDQSNPTIVSDGSGGAVVTWQDNRSGNSDIYAQRVNASGAVQWTANGVALCTATWDQINSTIASDGSGGAIATWQDGRSGYDDIYAQRVNTSGAVQWTANGVALCTAVGHQRFPTIAADGSGGAIATWQDYRSGTYDVYTQRVNASGAVQWTADGVALCTSTGNQYKPKIVSDGSGGAIVTWYDYRSGNYDIYVQRVNASGAVQWTANGVALCTATWDQMDPTIASDGSGGAIVTWHDYSSGTGDIYAQKVNASGTVQWTTDGVPLCSTAGNQVNPTIAEDGSGGAIVTWSDYRTGFYDIYAQSIDALGKAGNLAPVIYAVRDVPGDQGGRVYLSWYGARMDVFMTGDVTDYTIWRAISPTLGALMLEDGVSAIEDLSKLDLPSREPVVRMEQAAGRIHFWELVETVDALYMEAYGKPVATLFDSTSVCTEYHYFQVVAHTADPRTSTTIGCTGGSRRDSSPAPRISLHRHATRSASTAAGGGGAGTTTRSPLLTCTATRASSRCSVPMT